MDFIKEKKKLKIKKYTSEILLTTIGCMLMAMGTSFFLLPNQLSSGGFAGIATIIYYLFKLPLGMVMLALNIPFFIIAYIKLGRKFILKSILGTVLLALFIDLFDRLTPFTKNPLLACIYGRNCNRNRNISCTEVPFINRWNRSP